MTKRSRMGLLTASLAAASTLALSSCGTTVQTSSTQGIRQGLSDPGSASGTGTTGDGESLGATGSPGDGTSGSATGTSTTGSTGMTSTGGGGTAAGAGAISRSTSGRETRTSGPIKVGVVMVDFSKLAATFGVQASNQDIFAAHKKMFAYLNAHGGLAGRKIEPVYYRIDGAAADNASAFNAACAYVTQDHKVDVVLSFDIDNFQGFSRCLLKYGIPQIDGGQYTTDGPDTATTPNLFTPDALAHDRFASLLVKTAVARGWLTSKDVLGVVTQDCAVDNRVYDKVIVPATKAAGVKVLRSAVKCINGAGDIGTASSQISSTVLRFRSEGVTHVTLLGAPEGAGVLLFAQAASQQKYYPGYLLTSNSFADGNSKGTTWPADQLDKMKGIGWSPILDTGLKAKTTPRQAQAQGLCKTMDPTRAGADSSSDPNSVTTAFYGICDTVRLLEAMLKASAGAASVQALASAYQRVAEGLASAKLTDARFTSKGGRRDGAALVAPFSYKASGCRCFTYDGTFTPTS